MIRKYRLQISKAAIHDINSAVGAFKAQCFENPKLTENNPERSAALRGEYILSQLANLSIDPHSYPWADSSVLFEKHFHRMDLGDHFAYFIVVGDTVQIHRLLEREAWE